MKDKAIKDRILVDNNSYEQGMRDAWELARNICSLTFGDECLPVDELCNLFGFGVFSLNKVFEMDVKSVMCKVNENLEERQQRKAKVGEIIEHDNVRYIVLSVDQYGYHCINGLTFKPTIISFQCTITRTGDTNLNFVDEYNDHGL